MDVFSNELLHLQKREKFMIWFDLDNSPHVPLFKPIFSELEKRGEKYIITCRKFAQTEELLNFWKIPHHLIGEHAGKSKIKKILNLYVRSSQLKNFLVQKKILLAVSHGSRTQLITARRMGIKSMLMMDYEYTESKIFNYLSSILLIPKYIPDERLGSVGINLKKVIRYNGFKEELYLQDFKPDPNFRKLINIPDEKILIIIRPPSTATNYHDKKSEELLIKSIKYFSQNNHSVVLIVNRTERERQFIETQIPNKPNIKFLEKTVDGLQLLFTADISISGGGTMNREAALLGTKTYSIFTGRRPYLDEYLQELGKLRFIEKKGEIDDIPIERDYNKVHPSFANNLVSEITDIIINLKILSSKKNYS